MPAVLESLEVLGELIFLLVLGTLTLAEPRYQGPMFRESSVNSLHPRDFPSLGSRSPPKLDSKSSPMSSRLLGDDPATSQILSEDIKAVLEAAGLSLDAIDSRKICVINMKEVRKIDAAVEGTFRSLILCARVSRFRGWRRGKRWLSRRLLLKLGD